MIGLRGFFDAPLDAEQVLAIFRQTITEELSDHELRTAGSDPLSFELVRADAEEPALSVNAHNVVQEILSGGYDRRQAGHRIAQFAGMIAAALERKPVDARALYLAVRPHDYIAKTCGTTVSDVGPGDLRLVIAEDRGAYVSLLSEKSLAEAGLTLRAAYDVAERNLREVIPRLTIFDEDDGTIALLLEGYEWLSSGLLLVPKLLRGFAAHKGLTDVLIAAPSVEEIRLIDATRPDATQVLEAVMLESFRTTRIHSECVFYLGAAGEERVRVAYIVQNGRLVAAN